MLSVLSVDVGRFGPRVVPHPRARPKPIPNVWPKLLRRGEGPPARPKPIPNVWPKLLRRGEGPPARPKPIPNVWPKLLRRGEGPQRLRWVENALDLHTVWLRPAAAGPEVPRSARARQIAPCRPPLRAERGSPASLFSRGGLFQFLDVEFDHVEHGLHDAARFGGIFMTQQFVQDVRNDLPGKAVFVLEPTALLFLAPGRKLLPQLIHFRLRAAVNHKRNGFSKLEVRPTIEGHKLLTLQ